MNSVLFNLVVDSSGLDPDDFLSHDYRCFEIDSSSEKAEVITPSSFELVTIGVPLPHQNLVVGHI